MAALHIVAKSVAHLKHTRSHPTYWNIRATTLRATVNGLSFERRRILQEMYGVDGLLPDPDRPRDIRDPLNPDWSKKETDMTDERKLAFADGQHKS